ncbi:Ig-like domain-containing protein, partial [Lactococcus garvieae]|uniref:Ig-like domain-containing protein n=1 Tax=Lactococcus garvieae TaxID=1363 RepID=UPI0015D72E5E
DTTAPDAPVITGVTGNSTDGYTVTGTAEAGSTVIVKDASGNTLGSGTADSSGNYSVSLPGSIGGNKDISVTATDAAGNISNPTSGKTPADSTDTTAPDAPTITNVTGNSTNGYVVTGTAEVGSTVIVKDASGNTLGSATADNSGHYSVTLPAGSIGAEAEISVTATDAAGNVSDPATGTTPADADTTPPNAPIISSVTGDSSKGYVVKGKAEAGATVEIRDKAGKLLGTGKADTSGNYRIVLPAGSIGAMADIIATATDAAGNISKQTTGKTPADPADTTAPDAPVISGVTENPAGGHDVSGSAEPGSTITITDGNGNVIGTGTADDSGHFTVTLPAGSVKPGQVLNVTATDAAGNISNPSHVQIPFDTFVPVTFGGTGELYSSGLPSSYATDMYLPDTGESDNIAQTVAGFSILAFASMLISKLRRKKDIKE